MGSRPGWTSCQSPGPRGWERDTVTARTSAVGRPGHPRGHRRPTAGLSPSPDHPRRRGHRHAARARSSPPRPASTAPSCARTCPTSAATAPAAWATTSTTCATRSPARSGSPRTGRSSSCGIGNLGQALANYAGFRTRGFRVVALLDTDPARHEDVVAGVDVRPFERHRADRPGARRRHRRHRHPGRGRPAGRRPAGGRRDPQHPQLRAHGAGGPRRASTSARSTCPSSCRSSPTTSSASRPQVDRRPRSRSRRYEHPGGGGLPQDGAGGAPRDARPRRRRRPQAGDRRRRQRARHRGRGHRHLQPARGLRRRRPVPRQRRGALAACSSTGRVGRPRRCCPTSTSTTTTARSRTCSHVAAGLDSMAVGEGQILGQTREALRGGQELGTVGPALNTLFQQALRVGKRAHTETDIDRAAPSLVNAALGQALPPTRRPHRPAGARRRRRVDGRAGDRHRARAAAPPTWSCSTAPSSGPSASPRSTPSAPAPLARPGRASWTGPTWWSPAPARRT